MKASEKAMIQRPPAVMNTPSSAAFASAVKSKGSTKRKGRGRKVIRLEKKISQSSRNSKNGSVKRNSAKKRRSASKDFFTPSMNIAKSDKRVDAFEFNATIDVPKKIQEKGMSSTDRDIKDNCTFVPSMSKKSKEITQNRSKRDLSVQKRSKQEQIKLQKIKQDWEEMKECTFKPETNVKDKSENPKTIHRLY